MRARIHRGATEVGGSCVELEHAGSRIVLDLGLPLDAAPDDPAALPAVDGLQSGDDPSLLGIVISHGHPDHFGLVPGASPSVPRFIGEAAHRILCEASFFSPAGADLEPTGFLHDREPLELGPFRLTPFLVDHSAYDAYALLVEAGGRRLLYSGDLRAHGRKSSTFERLIRESEAVNVLLLEGTRVGDASTSGRGLASEKDVEDAAVDVFTRTAGMALAIYSAQNIDRVVSLYRAARRSDRLFVMDLYGATIAAATNRATIPQASWDGVGVFVPLSQRIRIKRTRAFDRIAPIRSARLYPEDLGVIADRAVLSFRSSMANELHRAGCLEGASALWSLWPGYLDQPSGVELRAWLDENHIPLTAAHASGHSTTADLRRLIDAKWPARIVPIHTRAPEAFHESFPGACIEPHQDGEWWHV